MALLSRLYFWWTVFDLRLHLNLDIWRVDRQVQKLHKVQAKIAGLKEVPARWRGATTLALEDVLDALELVRHEMVGRLQMLDQVDISLEAFQEAQSQIANQEDLFKAALEEVHRAHTAQLEEMTRFMDEAMAFTDSLPKDDADGEAKLKEWEENHRGIIH